MTSESTVTDDFTSIPILNYALLSSPDTRPDFIRQLQHALINVGFLYLENTPPAPAVVQEVVPDRRRNRDGAALFDEVIAYLPRIFALPQERKDAMRMVNSPHFLGYSRLGVERTGGAADQREQFDFATPFENDACQWVPGQSAEYYYVRLWGPNQVRPSRCGAVCFAIFVFFFVFASSLKWSFLGSFPRTWHLFRRFGQLFDPSAILFDLRMILINDLYHRGVTFFFFNRKGFYFFDDLIDDFGLT